VIRQHERLLDEILAELPAERRLHVGNVRSCIKEKLDRNASRSPVALEGQPLSLGLNASSPGMVVSRALDQSQRYLGEVSDVRFFNLVKRVLQTKGGFSDEVDHEFDSYEQDGDVSLSPLETHPGLNLPPREQMDQYINIYFSTIHLAYPFLPETLFRREYERIRATSDALADLDKTWLALLCKLSRSLALANRLTVSIDAICAIGAYYTSFPGSGSATEKTPVHETYFLWASSLAPSPGSEPSLNKLSLILTQCFYRLAVCKTDRFVNVSKKENMS
jgi:hypothetical protein